MVIEINELRSVIEPQNMSISIARQCELLGLSRSSYYYEPATESEENLRYMRLIDEQFLRTPFYGVPRMREYLQGLGYQVNKKRISRLYQIMDLRTIYPKPRTTIMNKEHEIYPYLLNNVKITEPNQVWSTDITYIPMNKGFMYLVAVMDWYSRYVLSWRLSNSMEVGFCLEVLDDALQFGTPKIFNTDQGSQFTSKEFTGKLKSAQVQISMDGKGRAIDNVFIERLWRSVKYEYVYINSPSTGKEIYDGMNKYFSFYNNERKHQGLGYKIPVDIWKCGL